MNNLESVGGGQTRAGTYLVCTAAWRRGVLLQTESRYRYKANSHSIHSKSLALYADIYFTSHLLRVLPLPPPQHLTRPIHSSKAQPKLFYSLPSSFPSKSSALSSERRRQRACRLACCTPEPCRGHHESHLNACTRPFKLLALFRHRYISSCVLLSFLLYIYLEFYDVLL